jgi:hypothetical protein
MLGEDSAKKTLYIRPRSSSGPANNLKGKNWNVSGFENTVDVTKNLQDPY